MTAVTPSEGQSNFRILDRQEVRRILQRAEEWRRLAVDLTRCEHGRIQGDNCFSCPEGISPSQAGRHVGYALDGQRIIIPDRENQHKPEAWYGTVRSDPQAG